MRKSTNIVVFYLFFTGAATLLEAAGVTQAMGVSMDGSVPQRLQDAQEAMQNVQASGGLGESLFGIYTAVTATVQTMFAAVSAGPRLLMNAGVPGELVAFLFMPAAIVIGVDVAYALSGRDL